MKWKWLYPKFFIHEGVVILEPVAIINKQKRLRHAVIILRSYTRRDNWPLLSQIRNHVQLIGKLRIGTAAHQFWAVNFSFWIWPILHENRKQDLKWEIGAASFISTVGCHRFQQLLLEMRLIQVNINQDLRSQTIYGLVISSNSSLISAFPVNHNQVPAGTKSTLPLNHVLLGRKTNAILPVQLPGFWINN